MDDVVAEVLTLLDRVRQKADELGDALNAVLRRVPDLLSWIADRIHEGWDEFVGKLKEFFSWCADKLAYAGDPGALEQVRDRWHEVAASTAALGQRVSAGELATDDSWQGDAADQYRQKIPDQKAAITAFRADFASGITSGVDALRGGIITFWIGVVVAVVALISGIIGALTSTATLFGAPAAPFIAAAAVLAALAAVGGGLLVLNSQASSAAGTIRGAASSGLQSWPSFALS